MHQRTEVRGGRVGRRWGIAPWVQAGVVALVFLALVVALLALPGGKVVGGTTTNIKNSTIVSGLVPGQTVVQPFVASDDRLAAVYVTFGTYGGKAQCDLRVSLVERIGAVQPGTGEPVTTQDWSCGALADTGPFPVLDFTPIESSAGRTYDVVIQRTDAGAGGGVAIWAGEPKGDAELVVVDGETQEVSTAVRAGYDPQSHRWDHMEQTLSRLAAYGPSWGSAGALVTLIALIGLLLAATPLARRSTRSVLVVVCLLALARGLVWSAAVPALEAMDEPAHFAYVQYLAEEGQFPGQIDNHEIASDALLGAIDVLNVESATPGDRPDYSADGEAQTAARLAGLSATGGGGGPGSMYAPFYYLPAVLLYDAGGGDILTQIALARLWSVLLGVAAAALLVLIGRRLFPHSSGAQLAFVIAGVFQPMIAHQFAIVNNDAWVIVAGFAALAVGLELARRGRAPGLAVLAGAVLGMGLLGKPFAIACAVPLAVGWLVGKARARERSVRVLVGEPLLGLLGLLGTYGLWSVAANRLGLATSAVPAQTGVGQTIDGYLRAQFGNGFNSAREIWADQLWGDFGWVRIPLPDPIPLAFFVLEVAVLVGLAAWVVLAGVGLVRTRRARSTALARTGSIAPNLSAQELRTAPLPLDVRILMVAVMIVGIIGTLYAAGWVYYSSTGLNNLIQGRYALLAVPALIAAPALLLERFTGGRLKPVVVNTVAAFGMVSVNLLGLLVMFEWFYG